MNIKDVINMGYLASDILDVYTKGNSKASKKIRHALSLGYPAATIVQHLFGKKEDDNDQYLTLDERSKKNVERTYKNAERNTGLTVAAIGTGLGLLARGGASAVGAASQVANTGSASAPPLPPGGSGSGPLTVQGIQQQAQQMGQPKPNVPNPTAPPAISPQQPVPEIDFFQTKLAKENPSGIIDFIENHQAAGKTPEETDEIIRKTKIHGPRIADFEEESGVPFSEAIKQVYGRNQLDIPEKIIDLSGMAEAMSDNLYSSLFDSLSQGKDTMAGIKDPVLSFAKPYFDRGEIKSPEDLKNLVSEKYGKNFPIEKNSKVITPEGQIGDVTHQKDGTSIIDEGTRRSASKTEDLIPMPKAWENIQVDLSKIPEQDRSSNLQQVAATEDGKQIVMTFWDKGDKPKIYIYRRKDGQPIDPEILKTISEESDIAVTSGMSFYGGWSTKDPSRGSAFHHRLKIMSQSAQDTLDDPNKPFVFERAPIAFKHGYLVAVQQELNRAERDFNAEFKPPKKKKKI